MFAEDCPRAGDPDHRRGPKNYLADLDWLEEMSKTHLQKQCPTCGYWVIWVQKE